MVYNIMQKHTNASSEELSAKVPLLLWLSTLMTYKLTKIEWEKTYLLMEQIILLGMAYTIIQKIFNEIQDKM